MVNLIINTRISPLIDDSFIHHVAFSTLITLGFIHDDVTIMIDSDLEIRKLNHAYRNIDETTDVLSFSSGDVNPETGNKYLGDVAISFPRTKIQAKEQGHSVKMELAILIVHGILHLAGYDHSAENEERKFIKLQNEVIKGLSDDWMMEKSNHLTNSFKNALNGIFSAYKTERNMRIHLFASLVAVIFGFVLQIHLIEWSVIILVISIVLMSELINTALEYLVNIVSPEKNEYAKMVKDVSAAAVLIVTIASIIIGGLIFLPKIIGF